MRYCTKCLYPETKPDLWFDDHGVCNACSNFAARDAVDWDKRLEELKTVVGRYRNANGSNYDCIVPVSGGKDSHYQLIRLLELGLNPLCVTATTDDLSPIGRRNIENMKTISGFKATSVSANPGAARSPTCALS